MLFARELSHSTRTSIECGPPYETVGAFCPHFIRYDKMKYLDSTANYFDQESKIISTFKGVHFYHHRTIIH